MIRRDDLGPDPFGGLSAEGVDSTVAVPRLEGLRQRAELRILIADSEPTTRRMLRTLLEQLGCQLFDEAADGLTALTHLHNRRFDLLISDLQLGEMTGLDLLRAVRADRSLRNLPVLIISAEARREQIYEAAQAGVNGYLLKPFTPAMLAAKLSALLGDVDGSS